MIESLKIGSGPPYDCMSLEEGDMYYDTLRDLLYYVDGQNQYITVCSAITQSQKQELRCEYCGCLYTNDEVICLHCGAPR